MTKKINVLLLRNPSDGLKNYLSQGLRNFPTVNLIIPPDLEEKTLLQLAPQAHIIIGWRPTKSLLLAADKLSLFINPGAGVQHLIPLFKEIESEKPITLTNGHGNSYFTAQHTVALLLALTNKIVPHHNWMVEGKWRHGDSHAASIPMRYRDIGLLGYGAVNQKVHQFLAGFDVKFHILRNHWNHYSEKLPTKTTRYESHQLDQFLSKIDTLIVAVPLTEKTTGVIQMEQLKLLGKDGLVVNVSRGKVVDEGNFYHALKDKTIAGAAIDVWYNYSPKSDENAEKHPTQFPFHQLDNVILSPHRAASPFSDLERWDEVIENIRRFTAGEKNFLNVVNLKDEY